MPCEPNGWHLPKRLSIKRLAVANECFSKASNAYSEQVGVKRQLGPSIGEIRALYSFIRRVATAVILIKWLDSARHRIHLSVRKLFRFL